MLSQWLRLLAKALFSRFVRPKVQSQRWQRLFLESIEDRITPATITWINPAGGSWHTASNWSGGVVPGINDDVIIPNLPGDLTVTFSTGTNTVKSIVNHELLSITGGTLTNDGNLAGLGTVTIQGGTHTLSGSGWVNTSNLNLVSGTLNLGGSFTTAGIGNLTRTGGTVRLTGVLNNTASTLTLNSTTGSWNLAGGTITGGTITTDATNILTMTGDNNSRLTGVTVSAGSTVLVTSGSAFPLTIDSGFTLNGTLQVGNDSGTAGQVRFDAMTVGGTGTIRVGNANSNTIGTTGTTTAVTLGPGMTIQGKSVTFDSNGVAGSAATWRFEGTTIVDAGGSGIRIHPRVGNFQQAGTVTIPTSTSFTIDAASWNNSGTINLASGTLNLGGSFSTASIGTLTRTGGTVNLTGNLDNSGDELILDGAAGGIGSITLALGGKIIGGKITTKNGATLGSSSVSNQLVGVMLTAGSLIEMLNSNDGISIVGGMVLDGTIKLYKNASVYFEGASQTISGSGRIRSESADFTFPSIRINTSGSTVTFGKNISVEGKRLRLLKSAGFGTPTGTYINNGTISTEDYFVLGDSGITLINESTGSIKLVGTGLLELSANTWLNRGVFILPSGTLSLGGNFSNADIGIFNRTGGTVNLTGTITGDLQLNDVTGSWNFLGGTLRNGTFSVASGSNAKLIATATSSTLDGVTLASPIDFESVNSAKVFVQNGLTLHNITQAIGNTSGTTAATIRFLNFTQSLGGTGTFVFGSSTSNRIEFLGNATIIPRPVVTIESGITIRGKSGTVGAANGTGLVNNFGTIQADVAGGTITYRLAEGSLNGGMIKANNGGTIAMEGFSFGTKWSNLGTIEAHHGTLLLGDQASSSSNAPDVWSNLGLISAKNATVNLGGDLSISRLGTFARGENTTVNLFRFWRGDFKLDDSTGSWNLRGAKFFDGSYQASQNAQLVLIDTSRFTNYTIDGPIDLSQSVNNLIFNNVTLNTTIHLGKFDNSYNKIITADGAQTLQGNGTIIFGSNAVITSQIAGEAGGAADHLVINPGITIRGHHGSFNGYVSIINRGRIIADNGINSGRIALGIVTNFSNEGLVEATNGGTVRLTDTNLTNLTGQKLTGGQWLVGPSSTLRLPTAIRSINADVTLSGGDSKILIGAQGGLNALEGLTEIAADGRLHLMHGRSVYAMGQLTTSGRLQVDTGSAVGLNNRAVLYSGNGSTNDTYGGPSGTWSGTSAYAPGLSDQAFWFSSTGGNSDAVNVPDQPVLRSQIFTVSVRIRPTSIAQLNSVLMKATSSSWNDGFGLSFNGTDGRLTFWINQFNATASSLTTPNPIPLNAWTRIDASYDGSTIRLYVDGHLVGSRAFSGVVNHSAAALRIGNGSGGNFPFRGQIDEVSVYALALTPAQVDAFTSEDVLGSFVQTSGEATINGTIVSTRLEGGILRGTGTIQGHVHNIAGVLAPGNSPGFIDITGDYIQGPDARLELEMAGRDPDLPQYDRVRITGTATLAGTANFTLLDGFEPTPGDTFVVLTAAAILSPFDKLELPSPGGALRRLSPIYTASTFKLETQQIPPLNFVDAQTSDMPSNLQLGESYADVAVDSDGNVYLVGDYTIPTMFDNLIGAYVRKLSPTGTELWTRYLAPVDESSWARGRAIAVDHNGGHIYVTGSFFGKVSIDTFELDQGSIFEQAFVLGLDTDGLATLLVTPEGGATQGYDIVASNGIVTVVGIQSGGTVDYDPSVNTLDRTAAGFSLFVWSLESFTSVVAADLFSNWASSGSLLVLDRAGVALSDNSLSPTIWVTGSFQGTASGFGTTLTSAFGSTDAFVLQLQRSGQSFVSLFSASYGGEGEDRGIDLTVDSQQNPVIVGTFQTSVDFDSAPNRSFRLSASNRDSFVLKLDSQGEFQWARQLGGYSETLALGVTTDQSGNVYTTGYFDGIVDFDPLEPSYILDGGDGNNFLWKLTPQGSFGWATMLDPLSDPAFSLGLQVAVSPTGQVYSVGSFFGVADFDPTDGIESLGTPYAYQTYYWHLSQTAAPIATIRGLPAELLIEGSSIALAASVTDPDSSYFTYAWSVTRGSTVITSSTGPALGLAFTDQGLYTVTLTVRDETGNRSQVSSTITVVNAAPVLNPATYSTTPTTLGGPATANNQLGSVIVTTADLILLGVPRRNSGQGQVEVLNSAGLPQFVLSSPSPVANGLFGASVAVVGSWIVVGEPGHASGFVHVYSKTSGAFVRTLNASFSQPGDRFGAALAAFGNFVLVGAPGRALGSSAQVGEAYLFEVASGELVQTYLNPTPLANDEFGAALAVLDGNLLIGTPGDDTAGLDAGAVYLFDTGTARLIRTITNPNPLFTGSQFGSVLAVSGTTLAIGAPSDDSAGTDAGGVYLFNLDFNSAGFGQLIRTVRSPNSNPMNGQFGSSLAFVGNRLLVGAIGDGTGVGNSGSAFLIDAEPTSESFGGNIRTFKKTSPVATERFGSAVAMIGDDIIIGASHEDSPSLDGGRVYRFNAASTISFSATTIPENSSVTVSGSFSDAGRSDSHTVTIDWGMIGTTPTILRLPAGVNTFSATMVYPDDGPTGTASDLANIRVRVLDDTPQVLAFNSATGSYLRYESTTGAAVGTFSFAGAGFGFFWTAAPNGDILTWNNPNILRYDGLTGASLGTFLSLGVGATVKSMSYSPSGELWILVEAAGSTTLQRRDGSRGTLLASYPTQAFPHVGASRPPASMAFGPEGTLYISANSGGSVFRFNPQLNQLVPFSTTGLLYISSLAVGADGFLYVAGAGPRIIRVDRNSGDVEGELASGLGELTSNADYQLLALADGSLFASVPYQPTAVTRLNVYTGLTIQVLNAPLQTLLAPIALMDEAIGSLVVHNVAPSVRVQAVTPTTGAYALEAVVSDPSPLDTFTYLWTLTGATANGPTNNPLLNFTPTSTAISILLTVTDDDTGSVTTRTQIIIGTLSADTITLSNTNFVLNGSTTTYTAGTNRVIVYGLAGNDFINASAVTTLPVELIGGFGHDTLIGGSQDDRLFGNNIGDYDLADPYTGDTGSDSLVGGAGHDTLDGGLGDDTMAGGFGNDYYFQVPGSRDLLTELDGDGQDAIDYSRAFQGITFSLARTDIWQTVTGVLDPNGQPMQVMIQGHFEHLGGSRFNDTLRGNIFNNQIVGGGGADFLAGGDEDLGFGGSLFNLIALILGDGDDTLAGGAGQDTIYGGSGNDLIFGGDFVGLVMGGLSAPMTPGDDSSFNSLIGGTGNDTIIGGHGNDLIFGGDFLINIPLFPMLNLSGVNDHNSIVGGLGDDTMIGGLGNDVIFGGDLFSNLSVLLNNTLPDNNTIIGGLGADSITGGAGNDLIFLGDMLVQLGGQSLGSLGLDFSSNSVSGGLGNDTIIGGFGNDLIYGGDLLISLGQFTGGLTDHNTIIGGLGSDTIVGGTGNDLIFGGDILVSLPNLTPPVSIAQPDFSFNSIVGGLGNDTIVGGLGNDLIFGGDLFSSINLPPGLSDQNTIIGGLGQDTLIGGGQNDLIFAGDVLIRLVGLTPPSLTPQPDTGFNSIVGGLGDDTIIGSQGNDLIFGGDLLISLGLKSPSLTGTEVERLATTDNDLIIGGPGSDTIIGGSGNDLIYGGDFLVSLPGFVMTATGGLDLMPNSLVGGSGNDTILGGEGNDIIFGGEGDDWLSGGLGVDLFEGGSGRDSIVETADADFVLTATQLFTNGVAERFYDIEAAVLTGGASSNWISSLGINRDGSLAGAAPSVFFGEVIFHGLDGNDTLIGGALSDQLYGGNGNDSLIGGAGSDLLDSGTGNDTLNGGDGNDIYILNLHGQQTLIDSSGIDSIDLTSVAFGIELDLSADNPKITPLGSALTLANLLGVFENVRGTPQADRITGHDGRNILEGAGGVDRVDGGPGNDVVQGGLTQVFYLDFDSGTNRGEHVYTVDQRNQIQERLERAFSAPFSVRFTQTPPSVGRFSTIVFNAGDTEMLVGGIADELDWRNINNAAFASININGFLGRKGQPAANNANIIALSFTIAAHEIGHLMGLRHHDAFGPIGSGVYAPLLNRQVVNESQPAVLSSPVGIASGSTAYVVKRSPVLLQAVTQFGNPAANPFTPPAGSILVGSTIVATFVVVPQPGGTGLGELQISPVSGATHTLQSGVMDPQTGAVLLTWTIVPSDTSIVISYQYDPYRPGYRGPDDAIETPRHIIASPASVSTSITDALQNVYFGERELLKLAFADVGRSFNESSLPLVSAPIVTGNSQARNLGLLPTIHVPNLQPSTASTFGWDLKFRAANVVGRIQLNGAVSENDVYRITGRAGDYLTAEVLSKSLRERAGGTIDAILRIYDANGVLLDWYGQPAYNDDGIDNQDPVIQDVLLPYDGFYYIVVDTFFSASVPDTQVGGYELFIYTFTPIGSGPRQGGEGDHLIGGPGFDILIGSTGDDAFNGDLTEDIFIGYVPGSDETGPRNRPPVAENDQATTSEDTVLNGSSVLANDTDEDRDPLTAVLLSAPSVGVLILAANGTYTYTPPQNFHGIVTFTYRAFDGTVYSDPAIVTITVTPVNDAPTATVQLNTSSPKTNDLLTATVAVEDVDEDSVSLTYVWTVDGVVRRIVSGTTSLSDSFDLSLANNGNKGQVIRVFVTPFDGTILGQEVNASATVINSAPIAVADAYSTPRAQQLTIPSPGLLLNDSDADFDHITLVSYTQPGVGHLIANPDGSLTYTPPELFSGQTTFSYTISDGLESSTVVVTLTVTQRLQVWFTGLPASANEEQSFLLTSGVVDTGTGLILSWIVLKDGQSYATGSGNTFLFNPNDNGLYTVQLNATNDQLQSDTDIQIALILNVAPSSQGISGPATVNLNDSASFTLIHPSDPSSVDQTSLKYSFALSLSGLATSYSLASSTNNASFTFTANGVQTVYARVYDKDGGFTTYSTTINVQGSGPVSLNDGILTVNGDATNDVISIVNASGGQISVWINGFNYGPYQGVQLIRVNAGEGHDFISVHANVAVPTELNGQGGNDTIVGGSGSDTIHGGAGDDSLVATSGNDSLWGGDGDDTLRGGSGFDTLRGGAGNDSLLGGSGRDLLDGGADHDTIRGGSAGDTIYGGDGHDSLIGGSANDTIWGGNGNDTINAGSGADYVFGEAGDDVIEGGAGDDVLVGGLGHDSITGGSGRDLLIGGMGADTLAGGSGDDVMIAGWTTHDSNIVTLHHIMTTWTSNANFSSRMSTLTGWFIAGVSVLDDNHVDSLVGGSGQQGYWVNLVGGVALDRISDRSSQDTVNEI